MGTCLYISATLLIETMETIVPFQGLMVSTGTCGHHMTSLLSVYHYFKRHVLWVLTMTEGWYFHKFTFFSWTDNDYRGNWIHNSWSCCWLIVFINTIIILRNISGDIKLTRIRRWDTRYQLAFFLSTCMAGVVFNHAFRCRPFLDFGLVVFDEHDIIEDRIRNEEVMRAIFS